jgi:hypothetical protein
VPGGATRDPARGAPPQDADASLTTLFTTLGGAPVPGPAAGRRLSARGVTRALLAGGLAVAAVALSGCADPEHRFVSSSERDLVVRVPWTWTQLDSEDVRNAGRTEEEAEQQEAPAGSWAAYFDGASEPAVDHVVSTDLGAPVVRLESGDIPADVAETLTTDQLRDLVLPVSEARRAQLTATTGDTTSALPTFRLISDTPVTTKTATGVHVVFAYKDPGGAEEVYDQVAVTDTGRKRWHLLFVHCSAECYGARRSEITEITDSFTVKKR